MENNNQNFISASDLLFSCLSRWKWFVLSVIVCLAAAYSYIKTTPPTYMRSTSVLLLNCGDKSDNYGDVDLEALGLKTPNTSLQNEMEMLHSPIVMEKVVDSLHLDVEYAYPGMFYDKILYGAEVPIDVVFSDESANDKSFIVKTLDQKNIIITDFNKPGEENTEVKGTLNTKIKTPCGEITVKPTATFDPDSRFRNEIRVTKYQVPVAADRFLGRLSVTSGDENSSVVKVSITDQNTSRAEDILQKLMTVYDENWRVTQNRIVENTSQFLADRVREVGSELGHVDNSIASRKGANLMPDAGAAGGMYMNQNNSTENSIYNYNTQLSMLRYIRNYLLDNMGSNRLLPANIGVTDGAIVSLINSYNTMQMKRNEMVVYAGDDHPKVRDLDQQLESLRKSIIESIDQSMTTIRKQVGGLQGVASQAAGKIVESTQQEKQITSDERDQKVKEALYTFLLQEKEKTDMTINHSVSNVRVTQNPGGSMEPISPLRTQIMLVALALGFGIPFVIIFVFTITDTKVRSRKDLEKLKTPFLGEIALDAHKKKLGLNSKLRLGLRLTSASNHIHICVEDNNRDLVNEGFRMVRTNLEFILRQDATNKVILVTSANLGSGKSFISANLAKSMSLVKKRILAIDLDMRRCTLSGLLKDHHKHGIANYLGHYDDDLDSLICRDAFCEGVDLLPVGTVPPNPTELLHDERLGELINKVRELYDFVIIDCPPIDIVADVDIINQFVDMTIFVIRAGLLDKAWLKDINRMYQNNRFNHMATVLNGTLAGNAYSRSRYGGYYGHYHYGRYGYYYAKKQ